MFKRAACVLIVLSIIYVSESAGFKKNAFIYKNNQLISKACKFSVFLPTRPKEYYFDVASQKTIAYQSTAKNGVFSVFIHELPPGESFGKEAAGVYLKELMKGSMKIKKNVKIIDSKEITLDRHLALRYRASYVQGGRAFLKDALSIFTKENAYTMSAIYLYENEDAVKGEVDRMFKSFLYYGDKIEWK